MLSLPIPSFIAGVMLCHFRWHSLLHSERGFLSPRKIVSAVMPLSTQTTKSNVGSPTSMNCDSQPMRNTSPPRKKVYGLSHIIQYLDQIEDILQSSSPSPAIRYNHCYPNQNNQTFFKSIGSALAKPMLRTLIYGDIYDNVEGSENVSKKIHFDKRIRESRVWLEGQKMYSFTMSSLRPAAEALDADVRDKMVPGLLDQIRWIEGATETNNRTCEENMPSMTWKTGTGVLFNRLATGRHYKGKLESLICDLFPELLDKYHEASQIASEREVLEFVVNADLIKNEQKSDEGWTEKRISAIFKCLDKFYPVDADQLPSPSEKQDYSGDGVQSGKRCEESCSTFLHNEYIVFGRNAGEHLNTRQRHKILQNIYVNARRNGDQPGQKYVPPKTFKRGSQKMDGSGIIWTDSLGSDGTARHRLCSEFDAIVVSCKVSDAANGQCNESNSTFIESIWEAKKTISPSTLHDILEKKLGAIEALVDDQGAELVYMDGETTETIPFSSEGVRFTFGVYGSELQRPENAADSIRSIAGSNVVTSNIHEVIRALERDDVMVEVELSSAMSIVTRLKSVVEEIQAQNQIEVKIFLEEGVDFL